MKTSFVSGVTLGRSLFNSFLRVLCFLKQSRGLSAKVLQSPIREEFRDTKNKA